MAKEPMWTDELDAQQAAAPLRELSRPADFAELRGTNGIRLVTRKGVVYEGLISLRPNEKFDMYSGLRLNGRDFNRTSHTVYLLASEDTVVRNPDPVALTDEEARDLIADLSGDPTPDGRARAVSVDDIVEAVIGFDPTIGMSTPEFGGRSKDGYIGQFLKIGGLRKSIAQLEADGVIRKVTAGSQLHRSADDRYARIHGRVGYVTVDAYENAVTAVTETKRLKDLDQLRATAMRTVAERHADEVEEELTRLAKAAGVRI